MPRKPIMNNLQRACQIWAVLVFAAKRHQTVGYRELSRATGLIGAMSKPLAFIQQYCLLKKLPPLTAIVVYDDGTPGRGFCAVAPRDVHNAKQAVFRHDWYENPKKTPANFTFEEAHTRWEKLTLQKRGEFIRACCDSVQVSDSPDGDHRKLCPNCK